MRQGTLNTRYSILTMKWHNHRITAGVIVFAAVGNIIPAIAAVLGSTFPDRIEGKMGSEGQRKRHRKGSHWFVPYVLVAVALLFLASHKGVNSVSLDMVQDISLTLGAIYPVLIYLLAFFFIGALLHIAFDSICGKVPSLYPKKRFGIKLFKVGSTKEYALVFLVIAISGLVIWGQL
ncbi:metal-dependent hydrolase [Thermodesulfovibrionales bacterium]|nr:metal-dependent hydrolase [Thermodesulfovibrionales bacterium]